jgi:hypothetical protein
MDFGDRGLVTRERSGTAPLPCPRVEIIGYRLGRRWQRDPIGPPTPAVKRLDIGFERADAMG